MANSLKILILLTILTTLPLICPAAEIDGVAAIVNDEIITSHEVDQGAAILAKEAEKGGAPEPDRGKLWKNALDNLIDKKLIEQKIKELGISISDEELRQTIEDVKKQNNLTQENLVAALASQGLTFEQYKSQLREQLERVRLMGQEVRAKIQVGEDEVRAFYEVNRKDFGEDDQYRARHIFFRLPQNAKPDDVGKVLMRAMLVRQEALSGKDFAELAKKHSDDPQAAENGGELGTFKKGDMLPEIENAVKGMKNGQVSDIVNTAAGFHIIKLEERIPGKLKPFDEVKGRIEEVIYKRKSEERFKQWLADLRREATIEMTP